MREGRDRQTEMETVREDREWDWVGGRQRGREREREYSIGNVRDKQRGKEENSFCRDSKRGLVTD